MILVDTSVWVDHLRQGDAALADALSTAFCLMDRAAIDAALTHFPTTQLEHIS